MSGGPAPDVKVIAEGMIRSAMGLATDVMRGARDTAIALSHELDRQNGMTGDDDAGRDFAKVYKFAAAATLDRMGFSSYVLGESGRGLMRNAREFMAQEDEPLMVNLVAACTQLAKACDRYADHVEAAKEKILQHQTDLFEMDMPWDQPMFGGNGYDGGLHNAVLEDPWIHRLGEVAHALDASEARALLPLANPVDPGIPTADPIHRCLARPA
ncbi:hypothetical protein ACFRR7_14990 [Streptomyces sp. NPDC056909]|uniref:hypothetical protein n=1 Tax=Streptomyces sp. NPDC056909 TaxID=3345963 RepID=UPI0036A2980D